MLIVIAVLLPGPFLLVSWGFDWRFVPGAPSPSIADMWTIGSMVLGYWGVLLSGYAAYQVKQISDKYFARARYPQVKERLDSITSEMANLSVRTAADLRGEKFVALIPVVLGEVSRVPGHKMGGILKRAKKENKLFVVWIRDSNKSAVQANTEDIYWNLFRTLTEMSEEISAYIKEQRAK